MLRRIPAHFLQDTFWNNKVSYKVANISNIPEINIRKKVQSLKEGGVCPNSFLFNYQWLQWLVWCQREFQIKNIHLLHLFFINNTYRCSIKGVPRNFVKFTGKHLCRKVASWSSAALLNETSVFSSEFFEIFESTVFTEHLLTTSSALCCEYGQRLTIVVETKILNNFRLHVHVPPWK